MTKDLLVLADEYAAATATFARSLALKADADSMSPIAREAGDKRAALAEAITTLEAAQPEVNAMLVGLLEPAFAEIQHVLGSTLELPFQRKSLETALELLRTALTAAKQAQPECALTDKEQIAKNKRDLLQQMQAQPERAPLICTWTQEDDFDMPGVYHTSCGEMWSFTEGGIKENNTKFCPCCGSGIKQGGQQ